MSMIPASGSSNRMLENGRKAKMVTLTQKLTPNAHWMILQNPSPQTVKVMRMTC